MSLRDQLQEELREVRFSETERERLKRHLLVVANKRPGSIGQRFAKFLDGYTEIPLPVGALLFCLAAFGLWNAYATLFVVDQATAVWLLRTGYDSVQVINQGVSVL